MTFETPEIIADWRRWIDHRDNDALERLITHVRGVVHLVIRGHKWGSYDDDDVRQEMWICWVRMLPNWDPTRGSLKTWTRYVARRSHMQMRVSRMASGNYLPFSRIGEAHDLCNVSNHIPAREETPMYEHAAEVYSFWNDATKHLSEVERLCTYLHYQYLERGGDDEHVYPWIRAVIRRYGYRIGIKAIDNALSRARAKIGDLLRHRNKDYPALAGIYVDRLVKARKPYQLVSTIKVGAKFRIAFNRKPQKAITEA